MDSKTKNLFNIAKKNDIPVEYVCLRTVPAMSLCIKRFCAIAINSDVDTDTDYGREMLAHELGHCMTGAFYNEKSRYDNRKKHENTADKWAVRQLVPRDKLYEAFKSGIVEAWELAELFGVSEATIKKASALYRAEDEGEYV